MKEIDIEEIILKNFSDKIKNLHVKSYPSIWDALHSSEYRKVSQRNFNVICEGFNIAEVTFDYISSKDLMCMNVIFQLHFNFEYAERKKSEWSNGEYSCGNKFSVKPELKNGIDDISISLDILNKVNKPIYELLWNNVPSGGGGSGESFKYKCIAGMSCEGHAFKHSHVKLEPRIINFFNYLFGIINEALDYKEHPEHRFKITQIEQGSFIFDEEYKNNDYNYDDYDNLSFEDRMALDK